MTVTRAIVLAVVVTALLAGQSFALTVLTTEDTNTREGKANNNYGTSSSVQIEPYGTDGYFHKYGWWKFDTAGAKAQLDTLYGAGLWQVAGVTFNASLYYDSYSSAEGGISAGYNADDSWTETGITWANQPGGTVMLDTVTVPEPDPGTHVVVTWDLGAYAALVNDILSGSGVTVSMQSVEPTGGGSAAIDAREFQSGAYAAYLDITVVPEPGCAMSLAVGLTAAAALRFRKRRW